MADRIEAAKLRIGGDSYAPAESARMPFGKDVCGNAAEVAVCRYFHKPWRPTIGGYDGGVDLMLANKTLGAISCQVKFTGRMKNDFYFTSAAEVKQKFTADVGISVALDTQEPDPGFVLRLVVRGWIGRTQFVQIAKPRVYGLKMPAYGVRPFELSPIDALGE